MGKKKRGCPICKRNPRTFVNLNEEQRISFHLPDGERHPICKLCFDSSRAFIAEAPPSPASPHPIVPRSDVSSDTDVSPVTQSAVLPADPMMGSFLVMKKPSEPISFEVVRTNWMYRRQPRVFRFEEDKFVRTQPENGQVKETFEYSDVASIHVSAADPSSIIIRFRSGKEAQFISCDRAKELVDLLSKRSAVVPVTA